MGIAERKERERTERRNRILKKATELILKKGLYSMSMQEIADGVEISKATLYLYFKNKEDILLEIMNNSIDSYIRSFKGLILDDDDGITILKKIRKNYIRLFNEGPDILLIAGIRGFLENTSEGNKIEKIDQRISQFIQQALMRGISDGTVDPDLDPNKVARIIMTVSLSIIYKTANQFRKDEDKQIIQETLDNTFELLIRGVAAKGIHTLDPTHTKEKD